MKKGARYPDYVGVSDVSTRSFEHMRVEAYFEGQPSLMFDEPAGFDIGDPPELSGQSRGWTPVHAQLAALAGCTAITVAVVARDQGFRYRGLRTNVRSLIDIRGFFFDLHLRPQYKQLNFDLTFDTRASAAKMRLLAAETHRRCPQLGLFELARIPMVIGWYREGSETPVLEERLHMAPGATPEELLERDAARPKRSSRRAKSRKKK